MAAAPQIRHFSEEDFLLRGLSLRCNGEPRRRKKLPNQSMIIEFQSVYGPHPGTIAAIWVDLQTTPNVADRIDESVTPDELLLVYRWFKGYESAFELKTTYQYPVKHIRNICRDLTYKLARLRKLKIDPNWEDDDGLFLNTTVDGIHYLIDEPRPFTTKYSSHKFGSKSALCYEYVLFTNKAKMAMLNGPYPAATHDRDIFKKKLKGAIEKKQEDTGHTVRVIADDGYLAKKLMHVLSCRNEMDPKEIAYFKDRALSRHEKFNGLTKVYDILTAKFRHDRGWNPFRRHPRHQACVESICVTIQYELDLGHKSLFDPYPT